MIVRIRQCCCALTTFVRLVAVFFLVFHLLLALCVAIWYTLFATNKSSGTQSNLERASGEVNDKTFDTFLSKKTEPQENNDDSNHGSQLDLLFVVLLEVFAAIGILFNLLLMLGIKMHSRSLFLPWLVFHFITILACFAGGVYLALWFTVLQTSSKNPEDKFLSVLALFPFVGGIFLIFLWIFVDQLYIQMGQKKNDIPHQGGALSAPGSSVSTRKNPNVMVIDHSSYSTMSYATLPRKVLGVGELERRHHALATPTRRPRHHSSNNKVARTKSMNSTAASLYTLPRQQKSAQSQLKPDSSNERRRHQRAKSLEHILDGSGSSGLPNYWIADGARLISRRKNVVHHQSDDNMLDESSLETNSTSIPSYCTVDRRHARRPVAPIKPPRLPISSDDSSDGRPPRRIYKVNSFQQHQLLQQQRPLGPHSSVELILADEPILKNCTVGNNASSNQVMIHYDDDVENHGVTRFNEGEEADSSLQSSMLDLDLNMLPLESQMVPQEAMIRGYHHNARRAGPRHRNGYNTDTIRSNHSAKSVTIANQVTEFHYSEDDLPSGSTLRRQKRTDWVPEPVYPQHQPSESPPPPPFPSDDLHAFQTTPSPPTPPPPPENLQGNKSWLSRLSPIKSKHKSSDEDHFVDLYYSVSDVRL